MNRRWLKAATMLVATVALAGGVIFAGTETVQSLTQKLWPPSRIQEAMQAIKQQKKEGLLSDRGYQMRMQALEQRRAGTFKPVALSVKNPSSFIQNGGFEKINRNTGSNRSRWMWWSGWSWSGHYVNHWEDRPEHVHSGKYSARIECKGKEGRIGIFTPMLPTVPGAKAYRLTFWAQGAGDNKLFVHFEGVTGSLRKKMPAKWTKFTVVGKPATHKKKQYRVYFYVIGGGTIWLDDISLVPVGENLDK